MKSRAAILHDMGQQWSVEDFELDPPRAGEVLVEMAAAGLCHSDEHIRNGDMSAPNEVMEAFGLPSMFPMIGGPKASGVVLEVGDGVTEFAPGDHVVTSFVAVCGRAGGANPGWSTSAIWAQVMIPGHAHRSVPSVITPPTAAISATCPGQCLSNTLWFSTTR